MLNRIIKLRVKRKGFSLFELLISLVIFGIITVVMSNLVASVANLSYVNDKRLDMIKQVDYLTNFVKNILRDSIRVETCKNYTNTPVLYIETKLEQQSGAPVTMKYILRMEDNAIKLQDASASVNENNCQIGSSGTTVLTSNKYTVINFNFRFSIENGNTIRPSKLVYIILELCDSGTRAIYECPDASKNIVGNPYKHAFGITIRNS
jgi:prepilin-type N-terminal cleavage/methylation domain-containing protein